MRVGICERNIDRMDIRLKERIICPICRNELRWEIIKRHNEELVEGQAECMGCMATYPIKNGIAVFLPAKYQNIKIWERSERVAIKRKNIKKESNVQEKTELKKPSEILGEIYIRNAQGQVKNEDLYHCYMEKIGMPDTLYNLCCLAQKCADEIDDADYILDFASGKCLLASTLSKSRNNHIIVSDINPIIVMQAKKEFEASGDCGNLSFMVFDMKKSPFRNKSIHTVTTLLGLQNIIPCKGILEEIDRIADVFLNISVYLTEELPENVEVLNKYHITDVWIKKKFAMLTHKNGWQSEQICTIMELAKGISREEIETHFAVMKFPVKDEMVEYGLTKYLITCQQD